MNTIWEKSGLLFQLIEVQVNLSASQWKFPRVPNLQPVDRNVKAESHFMEIVGATQLATSSTNVGLLTNAVLNKGYITLKVDNTDKVQGAPVYDYNPANYSGRVRPLGLRNIDWQNSFVNWPDATILPAVGAELILQVQIWYSYYE